MGDEVWSPGAVREETHGMSWGVRKGDNGRDYEKSLR